MPLEVMSSVRCSDVPMSLAREYICQPTELDLGRRPGEPNDPLIASEGDALMGAVIKA
jgi:hypothetical protein